MPTDQVIQRPFVAVVLGIVLLMSTETSRGQTNAVRYDDIAAKARPGEGPAVAIASNYFLAWTGAWDSVILREREIWKKWLPAGSTVEWKRNLIGPPVITELLAGKQPFYADTLPALYLGFDQPLPNDLVSLYLNIVESGADGPPLAWEAWDGTAWRTLTVNDGTGALARPGMVSFLAPAVAPRASASVASASGTTITTDGPLQAAQFVPGNRVVITSGKTSEMGTIASIAGATLVLQTIVAPVRLLRHGSKGQAA